MSRYNFLGNTKWLRRRVEDGLTDRQIAKKIGDGCTWQMVRYWRRKAGIFRGPPPSNREPKAYWPGH